MAEESVSEAEREPDSVTPTSHPRSSSRGAAALAFVALVVAAAALCLAGWMWIHPRSSISPEATADPPPEQFVGSAPHAPDLPPEAYTDTQRTDAKTKICQAYTTVDQGLRRNTNLTPEGGDTEVGALAIAANWRVSVYDGGQYLLARLEPATPRDLADAIRSLGNILMDIGAAATSGVVNEDPAQAPRIQQVDQLESVIVELCK